MGRSVKKLVGLWVLAACAPAFGADNVSDMALRRAGNESGVLRVLAPAGTASFCRDQPSVAEAVQVHVHGSQQLRLLECFVRPGVLKAAAEGARVQLQPLYSVSVHPATLDWAMPVKDFESIVAPPISSAPIEEAAPPGGALRKTITQWVAPAGDRKFMDCRRITKVHERDGKQSEDKAYTCARYLHIQGWAIVLGLIDGAGGDVETRLPAELEDWATKFAAANAPKPAPTKK
jgi:hypothetical protein